MTTPMSGQENAPVRLVTNGVAISGDPPVGWTPLYETSLVILVGVTGVGKSTLLQSIANSTVPLTILPDRRLITDKILIPQVQIDKGLDTTKPVTDRVERFEYTRRYRERYPGGMAHALTQLCVAVEEPQPIHVFDGLRGVEEVRYAVDALPKARFVVLHAPDIVRVQRLLHRQDSFDQAGPESGAKRPSTQRVPDPHHSASSLAAALPEAGEFFTATQLTVMEGWVADGSVSRDDVTAKLRIVISERRNYDPDAASQFLQEYAPRRSLILDTQQMTPSAIADSVIDWIRK